MTVAVGRLGAALRDLPHPVADVHELVADMLSAGVSLIHVPSPTWFSPTLDPAVLGVAAGVLAAHDLELAVGLGALSSAQPERAEVARRLGGGDVVAGWRQLIDAAGRLGATSVHFTVGVLEDRFDRATPWSERLRESADLLRILGPIAAGHGMPMVLKTHEEMTTFEVVRLIESVGGATVAVGFSPVNVLTRLEDPWLAAQRVAPYVHTLFLDDAAVYWDRQGLVRQMRSLGQGTIPWPQILELLGARTPVVLDVHRAELDMPFYRSGWVADHPDLTAAELLAVASVAAAGPSTPDPIADRQAAGLKYLHSL